MGAGLSPCLTVIYCFLHPVSLYALHRTRNLSIITGEQEIHQVHASDALIIFTEKGIHAQNKLGVVVWNIQQGENSRLKFCSEFQAKTLITGFK